jgi:hyperosmotically inducible periplasmic protein
MKRLLIGFLAGVAVGAGGYWYVDTHRLEVWQAKQKAVHTAEAAADSIKHKVSEVKVGDIMEELNRSGTVIREKAAKAGEVIVDATADARLTGAIKTKLIAEPGLSALKINVDTKGGEVTLSGSVATTNQLVRAINITLQTEGVRKVTSTLQVAPPAQ